MGPVTRWACLVHACLQDRKPIAAVVKAYKEARETAKPRSNSSSSAAADLEAGSDREPDREPEPEREQEGVQVHERAQEQEGATELDPAPAPAPTTAPKAAEPESGAAKMTPEEMAASLAKLKGDEPVDAHGDGPKQQYGTHEGAATSTLLDIARLCFDVRCLAQVVAPSYPNARPVTCPACWWWWWCPSCPWSPGAHGPVLVVLGPVVVVLVPVLVV